MKFHEARLNNGLQVVAELNPHVLSVAVGFFVRTGSRDETDSVSGVSHFLEHMAFKGNDRYSADDVNRIFDEVGAKYNASTSEEVTLYYGAILPEYLPRTFELLSCLPFPALRQEDFDTEKKVILEEIGMYDDQPSFIAYDALMQTHFAGHPLGRSILGAPESIQALLSEQMRAYHAARYQAGNIVLAVAGNADWDQVLELARAHCGGWPSGSPPRETAEAHPSGGLKIVMKEASLQEHLMQMSPAPTAESPWRVPAEILSVIVGDDAGSRLFWELTDPGDADAAELGYSEYDGSGGYMTYLNCSPAVLQENLRRIRKIYDDINRHGVTEEELEQARNKVLSRIVLRSERPMGRLSSLGGNWIYRREYRSVEDDLAAVRAVTRKQLRELLEIYPLGSTTTVAVGPMESIQLAE